MAEQIHPDADLLLAYEQWRVAKFALEVVSCGTSEAIEEAERRINTLPARGLAGLAVKMRLVLAGIMDSSIDAHNAFVCDGEPNEQVKRDYYPALLWSVIEDIECRAEAEGARTGSAAAA